jgi:AbrB family looped-hinge helix DNA binding protein
MGKGMTETVIDERGRVLIPEEIRSSTGLSGGTLVAVEKKDKVIVIRRLSKGKREWRQLCGLVPKRTGKPDWQTPEEPKNIWH